VKTKTPGDNQKVIAGRYFDIDRNAAVTQFL